MDNTEGVGYSVSGLTALTTLIQTQEIFQYIQLTLAILVGIATLIYTIIKSVKLAKQDDGKIDANEGKEIIGKVIDGVSDIKDTIDDITKKKGDKKDGNNHKD